MAAARVPVCSELPPEPRISLRKLLELRRRTPCTRKTLQTHARIPSAHTPESAAHRTRERQHHLCAAEHDGPACVTSLPVEPTNRRPFVVTHRRTRISTAKWRRRGVRQ